MKLCVTEVCQYIYGNYGNIFAFAPLKIDTIHTVDLVAPLY